MSKVPEAKLQYSIVVNISAPIERCFIAASAENDMMSWVPNPVSVVYDHSGAKEPYDVGSYRIVTLKNGMAVAEHVLINERPTLFGYFIPSFGVVGDAFIKRYQGRMEFEPIGSNHTKLIWNGYFDCPGWRGIIEPIARMVMRNLVATMAKNLQNHLSLSNQS